MTDNPVDLAREVLDAAKHNGIGAYPARYAEPVITCANAAPTLASAVLSLTAEVDAYREETTRLREQVARIKALADQYDANARLEMREGDVTESLDTQATADRIRAALNGDHRG